MPRYILYARKSTESEDRQVLSIDSQIRELREVASSRELDLVDVFSEARSAKAPGREVFGRMMDVVAKGRADGILCWKLDRLARNPVDGGAIIWALDEGRLREIATREKTFANRGDDKFWMQLEFGMAKKYVDDLSDNVRRGNRAKLEQGWLPGVPPLGYINDLATKTILPDPDRFRLVRKMWESVLSGRSPIEVLEMANTLWGFRTRKHRRIGGGPVVQSTFYKMLSNPFYYGLLARNGESYPGAHEPMVTKDEFDRVQELLGRPNRQAVRKYAFPFSSLINCGECSAAITAEHKVNRFGSRYIYYHCTRRKTGRECHQPSISAETLESQIQDALRRIELGDEYLEWVLKHLREAATEEGKTRWTALQSREDALHGLEKQIQALLDLRLRGLISDEEYGEKKKTLATEQLCLKEQKTRDGRTVPSWFEPANRALFFANQAPRRFSVASPEEKREIVTTFGSNLLLRDKILRISAQTPFLLIEEERCSSSWQGLVEGMRTFFREHPTKIQWPGFCREIKNPRGK